MYIIYLNSKRQDESSHEERDLKTKRLFCAEFAFYRFTYNNNNNNKINNNKDTLFVFEERRRRRIKHLARGCGRGSLLYYTLFYRHTQNPRGLTAH